MNELRVGRPRTLGGITLIPIGMLHLTGLEQGAQYWFHGTLDPVAVVIQAADGITAWDISGQDYSIEELIATVPGLARVLEAET